MVADHIHDGVRVPRMCPTRRGISVCPVCKHASQRKSTRRKQNYDGWWQKQKGLCAFCSQPMDYEAKNALDHNHGTGEQRGLVHYACNQAIAGLESAIRLVGLASATLYVKVRS